MTRKRMILLLVLGLAALTLALLTRREIASAPPRSHATTPPTTSQAQGFDKHRYSLTDATSLWVIVNKQHPVQPRTYVPADLVIPDIPLRSNITGDEAHVRQVMVPELEAMIGAAKHAGLTINLQSGYRSYNLQVSLYNSYVHRDGQTAADTYSARPGFSEHQTGLAADLGGITQPACNVETCFGTTPEGVWLASHAYQFGFIIRYTPDKQSVTGYESEPWHVRYVGTALSNEMHKEHVTTLEEFFGVSGGTTYAAGT